MRIHAHFLSHPDFSVTSNIQRSCAPDMQWMAPNGFPSWSPSVSDPCELKKKKKTSSFHPSSKTYLLYPAFSFRSQTSLAQLHVLHTTVVACQTCTLPATRVCCASRGGPLALQDPNWTRRSIVQSSPGHCEHGRLPHMLRTGDLFDKIDLSAQPKNRLTRWYPLAHARLPSPTHSSDHPAAILTLQHRHFDIGCCAHRSGLEVTAHLRRHSPRWQLRGLPSSARKPWRPWAAPRIHVPAKRARQQRQYPHWSDRNAPWNSAWETAYWNRARGDPVSCKTELSHDLPCKSGPHEQK